MRSCMEVSELASQALDRELRLRERVAVRVHLLTCRGCARFRRQLAFLRMAARMHATRGLDAAQRLALRPEAYARIRQRLSHEA